ncbi:MAG: ABC transporter ATP-binding protein [Elusimicrobiota bacterium]|nr:ABC transporter ATP-binding protein [Elusimicrobiota bacterium]
MFLRIFLNLNNDIMTYKRILKYFRPYLPRFISAILCMAVVAGLNGSIRLIIKPTIDKVFFEKNLTALYLIALAIPTIYFLLGVFNYAKTYLMAYIAQKITLNIRDKAYEHLQYLHMGFYTKGSTGKIMSRLTNDIMALQLALNRAPAVVVCDGLTVVVLILILFYLHWKLALISLVVFPVASIPIIKFSIKLRFFSKQTQRLMAEIYNILQQSITAINITKAFSREKTEIERFKNTNQKFYTQIMRFTKVEAISSPVMEFIGAVAIAVVLFFAAKDVLNGVWTAGSFFAFFAAAFSVYQPLKNFVSLNPQIQQAISGAERIFEFIDEKPEIVEFPNAQTLSLFEREIKFENVTFGYNETQPVLKNLSFQINFGEKVAIVGASGSGKTTIIHLLLRFYDPESGRILIDGHNIKNVTLKSLRNQIGIVTQETILFNDTIRYNIAYGIQVDEDITGEIEDEKIIEAARISYADEFISKLPLKYNTIVGERGVLLSGGEKQRIAIARAIIRNPRILLLDEATSALDAESERIVQQALNNLMKGRTTLIVAHRLATVKDTDRILVLDEGTIVDSGTHDELIRKEGLYSRLHRLQII